MGLHVWSGWAVHCNPAITLLRGGLGWVHTNVRAWELLKGLWAGNCTGWELGPYWTLNIYFFQMVFWCSFLLSCHCTLEVSIQEQSIWRCYWKVGGVTERWAVPLGTGSWVTSVFLQNAGNRHFHYLTEISTLLSPLCIWGLNIKHPDCWISFLFFFFLTLACGKPNQLSSEASESF